MRVEEKQILRFVALEACSGWGRNPTLRAFPVLFHYIPDGIFADGKIMSDPAITPALFNQF